MKKFFVEIGCVGFLVFFTGYYFDGLKKQGFADFIGKLKVEYEIVNFGTSHGYDFNYFKTPLRGVGVNRDGNTLYYDLQNYFYLKENGLLAEKAIIVLPISYFIFGLDENRSDRGLKNPFVDDFYFYLKRNQVYNYSVQKEIRLRQFNGQKNFKTMFDIPMNFIYKRQQNTVNRQEKKVKEPLSQKEKIRHHAEERAKNHYKMAKLRDPDLSESYLKMLIADALKSGYKPVLVTVPYSYWYNNGFESQWLKQEYFKRMKNLSTEFEIPYLNYSHDERFTHNETLFKDSDHLNQEGIEMFSEIFLEDIGFTSDSAQ